MAQVLMMKKGSSKKQLELSEIESLKLTFNDSLNSQEIDESLKLKAIAYLDSVSNYAAADPIDGNGKTVRAFLRSALLHAINILNDKRAYDPTNLNVAQRNWWGNYDRLDVEAITNRVGLMLENQNAITNKPTISNTPTQNYHYTYDWTGGKNFDLLLSNSTVKDRIKLLSEGLLASITQLQDAKNNNKIIHGLDDVDNVLAQKDNVTNLISYLDDNEYDEDTAFTKLYNILNGANWKIDADNIKRLFPEKYSTQLKTPSETNLEALLNQNYTQTQNIDSNIQSYLDQMGWHLMDYDGNTYIYDNSYNPVKNKYHVFTDFTKDNYGYGLFADENGKYYYGRLEGDNAVNKDMLGSNYNTALSELSKRGSDVPYYKYNRQLSANQLIDDAIENLKANTTIDNTLKTDILNALSNDNLEIGDLSYWFDGDDIVLGLTNSVERSQNPYGINWVDHNIIKYNPTTKQYSFEKFNPQNYKHEGADSLKSKKQFETQGTTFNIDHLNDVTPFTINELREREGQKIKGTSWTYNSPVQQIYQAIMNWNSVDKNWIKFFEINDRKKVAKTAWVMWRNGTIQFNDNNTALKFKQQLMDVLNSLRSVQTNKQGGILFMLPGGYTNTVSDSFNEQYLNRIALERRANTNNRSIDRLLANESTELTSHDYVRIATTAADIVGLIASFCPVYGSAVAVGESAIATTVDLINDMTDPAVGWGDTIKNFAFGLGISAASEIPGMRAIKITKTLKRLLPKLIVAGVGVYSGTLQYEPFMSAISKLRDDKELTVEDWRNMCMFLKTISGVGKVVGSVHNDRVNAGGGIKGSGEYEIELSDGKKAVLSKSDRDLLKNTPLEERNAVLSEILKLEVQLKDVNNIPDFEIPTGIPEGIDPETATKANLMALKRISRFKAEEIATGKTNPSAIKDGTSIFATDYEMANGLSRFGIFRDTLPTASSTSTLPTASWRITQEQIPQSTKKSLGSRIADTAKKTTEKAKELVISDDIKSLVKTLEELHNPKNKINLKKFAEAAKTKEFLDKYSDTELADPLMFYLARSEFGFKSGGKLKKLLLYLENKK